MSLSIPAHLAAAARLYMAEEVRAEVRHAMRNKLGSIRNALYYLRRQVETKTALADEAPRVPRFFDLIEGEIAESTELLTSQLPTAQERARASADVDAVCARLLASLQPPEGLSLEVRNETAGCVLALPELELELALFLLLENACGFAKTGAVTLRVRDVGGLVELSVEDEGLGFTSEALTRGCESLFSTREGHQGLGLTVARRLIEGHGSGQLVLSNRSEGGARVAMVLASKEFKPPAAATHAVDAAPGVRRVLFVDDNATNRFSLGALLEDEGYEVVEAGSLAEARQAMAGTFALAILDVHLGDGMGTSLIPELNARTPKPVVAVLSGSTPTEVKHPGADLVFAKAEEPGGILRQINEAIRAAFAPEVGLDPEGEAPCA